MQKYDKAIAATIAASASESSAIDVSAFKFIAVELPATTNLASSTVTVYVKGCDTSTGTFRTVTINDVSSIASATTGNIFATVDMFIPSFMKICLNANTATAAAGYAARIHAFY